MHMAFDVVKLLVRWLFIMAVALGKNFSIILTEEGTIFGVGRNNTCALRCKDSIDRENPVMIPLMNWSEDTAVMVSAGLNHSACVTKKVCFTCGEAMPKDNSVLITSIQISTHHEWSLIRFSVY